MSDTMLACVRKGPNKLAVEEIQRPKIQAPTDAIVKTSLCTICGTDAHMAELPFPGIAMGHEAVGEIVELGPGVDGYKIGDRVVFAKRVKHPGFAGYHYVRDSIVNLKIPFINDLKKDIERYQA